MLLFVVDFMPEYEDTLFTHVNILDGNQVESPDVAVTRSQGEIGEIER